ncbi:hypothetical protein NDU88_006314 [Pleurodeles waltl]|uniref:Uncharacterized protein n=1 Tax=Pleurodeles waltl TaxID=8319 RepID=A0AAV7WAD9_PLEWA|nr:hypothetical protein NDU88_006314 [Pleurodeles waltl]
MAARDVRRTSPQPEPSGSTGGKGIRGILCDRWQAGLGAQEAIAQLGVGRLRQLPSCWRGLTERRSDRPVAQGRPEGSVHASPPPCQWMLQMDVFPPAPFPRTVRGRRTTREKHRPGDTPPSGIRPAGR